jgi:acetyl-CoA carboxylase beta subunit
MRPPLPGARPRAHPAARRRGQLRRGGAELRSDDPLEFFDLRPYTERLAEAELSTGLGEAMVIGRAAIEDSRASSR